MADPSTRYASERGTYIEIVGKGTSDSARSNARTLDWYGNENISGTLRIYAGTANEQNLSDLANKANKSGTVLNTTLSRGRASNTTVGTGSMAFGNSVEASGRYAVAQGDTTVASGEGAVADGQGTIANHAYQHASGTYNVADDSTELATAKGTYVEIVGNG